jgi:hypothetical protein
MSLNESPISSRLVKNITRTPSRKTTWRAVLFGATVDSCEDVIKDAASRGNEESSASIGGAPMSPAARPAMPSDEAAEPRDVLADRP